MTLWWQLDCYEEILPDDESSRPPTAPIAVVHATLRSSQKLPSSGAWAKCTSLQSLLEAPHGRRYGPDQILGERIAVDDVVIMLEGQLSVSSEAGTVTAGPGEINHLPKGQMATIRSHEQGTLTA